MTVPIGNDEADLSTQNKSKRKIKKQNPLDADPSTFSSESGEDDNNMEQQQVTTHEVEETNSSSNTESKILHYLAYGAAFKKFDKFCFLTSYILPNGWWIKFRLYNRRYSAMYNSFQPRPTAWAPIVIRLFLFSVSVASSLGGCLIPLSYVGSMALLVALIFLFARPCRRPFDNVLLALQLILASTLAFARASDPELSTKLFYGVVGVTFVYCLHIFALEVLETVGMHSLELAVANKSLKKKLKNKKGNVVVDSDDDNESRTTDGQDEDE